MKDGIATEASNSKHGQQRDDVPAVRLVEKWTDQENARYGSHHHCQNADSGADVC